jgi:hypothetical protein
MTYILNNIEHFYFYDFSIASYIIKMIGTGINAVYLPPITLRSIRRLMPSTYLNQFLEKREFYLTVT